MTLALGSSRLQSIPLPGVEPEEKSGAMLSRPALIGLVAAGFLGVVILAVVLIKVQTKDGTLIVEVDQPDAMVQVLDSEGKVEISQKGGVGKITIGVDPGKHRLKVEKDGFAIFGQEFELEKGGKTEITAKLEPVKLAAVVGESNTTATPPLAKAPFDAAQAKAHQAAWSKYLGTQVETTNSIGMRMTLIPPGEFLMGSTPEEMAVGRKMGEDEKMPPNDNYFSRLSEEMPQHKVTITQPFLMDSTEVTVAQFRKFVETSKYVTEAEKYGFGNSGGKSLNDKVPANDRGMNWKSPGHAVTDDSPVTQITWNDAAAYCAWLGEQEQRRPWYRPDGKGGWLIAARADGYRLPTEAEWEYVCRAGTATQYSFGDDKSQLEQYGWFNKNAGGKAQPVALKLPNPFGLFDMHGNAQEWCQDWYDGKWYEKSSPSDPTGPSSGSVRLLRGGERNPHASGCRSAYRNGDSPSSRYATLGFRIVRVTDATSDSRLATETATPQPTQPWNTPAFQAWVKEVQAMPAEKQIEAVSKKLMELNPGFDGRMVAGYGDNHPPKIENGVLTGLGFLTLNVTDISPVRALPGLKSLGCPGSGGCR